MNEPCALVDNRLNRIPGDERDSIWDGHLLFDKMGLLAGGFQMSRGGKVSRRDSWQSAD